MANKETLHALALRVVKAQQLDQVAMAHENEDVIKEGKNKGISPNEITNYAMQNYNKLKAESINEQQKSQAVGSVTGTVASTLSAFKDWWAKNQKTPINSPEFGHALHVHVNDLKGQFDFYS